MKIEIDVIIDDNKFKIKANLKDMQDLSCGDLLRIINSLKKTTENNLANLLMKKNIKLTNKNANKVLSEIKVSELAL
jgi:hypothetical protein